jgi:hypothetical protein
LLTQVRFAAEPNYAIAMMIEKIVGEDLFANAKGDVSVADIFVSDFRQRFANFN